MNKVLAIIGLVVISASLSATDLSNNSEIIKKVSPERYATIRAMAIDEWGTDHSMIVFTINRQCEAYREVIGLAGGNIDIIVGAIAEWTEGGAVALEAIIDNGGTFLDGRTDWTMVIYQTKRQISSKSQY